MLKVTQYYPDALSGEFGTASAVRGWSRSLAAAGAEVRLIVDPDKRRLPSPEGVECVGLPHVLKGRLRLPTRLETVTSGADLVVLHGGWVLENIVLAQHARKRSTPYLVTAHGVYHPRVLGRRNVALKQAWNVLLERRHLSRALAVHCFFGQEQDYLRRMGVDVPVVVAPNGFSVHGTTAWLGRREGNIVWLGRFDPECKGLDLLLDAMRLLPLDERPHLAMHGPDWNGQKSVVIRLTADLALGDWVTVGEAVYGEDKSRLLESAAAFVYPSRWDACPMSVVEAVSLGIPTLVTPYPLGRFLATEAGAILAECTAPALADGLRRLRAPDSVEVGKRGAAVVRDAFSWDVVAKSWLEQVEGLLRTGGGVSGRGGGGR